jgi:hypothetical protein
MVRNAFATIRGRGSRNDFRQALATKHAQVSTSHLMIVRQTLFDHVVFVHPQATPVKLAERGAQ